MGQTSLYYECHVTVEPIEFEEPRALFDTICREFKFWTSEWILKKDGYHFFATSRSTGLAEMQHRMIALMEALISNGFKIWRYKIEDTVVDSKIDSGVFPLSGLQNSLLADFDKVQV